MFKEQLQWVSWRAPLLPDQNHLHSETAGHLKSQVYFWSAQFSLQFAREGRNLGFQCPVNHGERESGGKREKKRGMIQSRQWSSVKACQKQPTGELPCPGKKLFHTLTFLAITQWQWYTGLA